MRSGVLGALAITALLLAGDERPKALLPVSEHFTQAALDWGGTCE